MHALVPNILQEPLGRNHAADLALDRLLVDEAADRGELQALVADVAIERHLVARGAALGLARNEVGEIGLVAPLAAIHEFGVVATETGLRVLLRNALHLLDGAADIGGG